MAKAKAARVRIARMAAAAPDPVPRVRRFNGLKQAVQKMVSKDSQTFQQNGVTYVHQCKKRRWKSAEEKQEV